VALPLPPSAHLSRRGIAALPYRRPPAAGLPGGFTYLDARWTPAQAHTGMAPRVKRGANTDLRYLPLAPALVGLDSVALFTAAGGRWVYTPHTLPPDAHAHAKTL